MTNHTTDLIKDVDRCVACGLCLDSCPTYQATQCEGYSPRGRILLAAGLANKRLAYSDQASLYLQSCLHCGSCEKVCPAHVAYGKIIDQSKALLRKQGLLQPLPAWLRLLTHCSAWRKLFGALVALWQKSGLQKLFRTRYTLSACGAGRIASFEAMLPSPLVNRARGKYKAPAAEKQNRVQLFSGCIGAIVERPTLAAAKALLEASAYQVKISKAQQCCGALYQHNGELDKAQYCLQTNTRRMSSEPNYVLISCASGCGAHWQQFAPGIEHYDIMDFLLEHADLHFEPLTADVALHTPCTAKTCMRKPQAALELLNQITGLRVHPISTDNGDCCGAGGADLLQDSKLSETLIHSKIEALQETGASILLTSNSGCAMHFRRALYRRKIDITVMHPCVLLYQQLRRH